MPNVITEVPTIFVKLASKSTVFNYYLFPRSPNRPKRLDPPKPKKALLLYLSLVSHLFVFSFSSFFCLYLFSCLPLTPFVFFPCLSLGSLSDYFCLSHLFFLSASICPSFVISISLSFLNWFYPVLWIRIRIGHVFRSFLDTYSEYGSGSTHANIGYNRGKRCQSFQI